MYVRVLACCLLGAIAGCGGAEAEPVLDVHPVSGTVTVDGQPASGVTVTFFPSDGAGTGRQMAVGRTDESGQFTLAMPDGREGAPEGQFRVLFARILKPDGTPIAPGEMAADVGADNVLPDVYNNPSETPVSARVPAGGDTFDFELRGRR